MKRTLLIVGIALLGCANATEVAYSNSVKMLYSSPTDTKVIGKLLPTSKVEVLEKSNDRVKVKIEGYVQKGKEQAVYFVEGKRILVAAFKKSDMPKYEVTKKGDWNQVSLVAYTENTNFESDLKPMMDKAAKMYSENCSMCHALHDINEYGANQWPSVFKSMVNRTAIDKNDKFLVTEYLQKTTKKK